MLQGKGRGLRGLRSVKLSEKDIDARRVCREKGVESIKKAKSGEAGNCNDLENEIISENECLFEPNSCPARIAIRNNRGKKCEEDYSEFSKEVADILMDQDSDLENIGDVVLDMHGLATAMNHELKYQEKIISQVQKHTDDTSKRAQDNAKKISVLA